MQKYRKLVVLPIFTKNIVMRFYLCILAFVFVWACSDKKNQKIKPFSLVTIEMQYIDTVSIRAILPLDENRVWFAGNNGKVGLIDNKVPKIAHFTYQDSLLQFRSIAKTKDNIFVLSISNPAILYKIGFDGLQATAVEEVYFEEHEKVFYNAMQFFDDNEGIAMGDPLEDCLSILITRNGGNTWEKLPCNQLPKLTEGEAGYAASNSNIAIQGDKVWIVTGGQKSRVFFSPDRGKTWDVFDTPITSGGRMTGIYSVDFYDENLGITFGGDWENMDNNVANKAITEDGGKTWTLLSDGTGPGYRSSVRFVPGRDGEEIVAVGSKGIAYSSDRGQTWSELSKEGFFAIEFVNDSTAFASGNNKISKLIFK